MKDILGLPDNVWGVRVYKRETIVGCFDCHLLDLIQAMAKDYQAIEIFRPNAHPDLNVSPLFKRESKKTIEVHFDFPFFNKFEGKMDELIDDMEAYLTQGNNTEFILLDGDNRDTFKLFFDKINK